MLKLQSKMRHDYCSHWTASRAPQHDLGKLLYECSRPGSRQSGRTVSATGMVPIRMPACSPLELADEVTGTPPPDRAETGVAALKDTPAKPVSVALLASPRFDR
jgi:hypothetical protein